MQETPIRLLPEMGKGVAERSAGNLSLSLALPNRPWLRAPRPHFAGCSSIGPGSVPRDRIDYAGALADSWKQQTLLNVVRLRYADTPTFMDVSSVIASYAFIGSVAANANVNIGAPSTLPSAVGSIGASGSYVDRPTLSYTPLTGDKFTKSLLRPIPPDAIFR